MVAAAATFLLAMGKLGNGKAAVAGVLAGASVGLGVLAGKGLYCETAQTLVVDPVTGQLVDASAPASSGGGPGAKASLFANVAAQAAATPATASVSPFSRIKGVTSSFFSSLAPAPQSSTPPGVVASQFMPAAPADPSSSIRIIGPKTGTPTEPVPSNKDIR